MKTRFFTLAIIVFILSIFSPNAYAQVGSVKIQKFEFLNGLIKAGEEDIANNQGISIDGESIPVYNAEGKRVKGFDLMKYFTSGDYFPDFYVDKSKEVKAILLRKATEEERAQMKIASEKAMKNNNVLQKPAPTFNVIDLEGNPLSLEKLKGKIVVMNFWFTGCKPCKMEIPELNQLVEKYKDEDIVFLGLALDKKQKLQSFLDQTTFAYKIIPSAGEIAKAYQINAYPTHIIINKNSEIVFSTTGLSPNTIATLDETISKQLR